MPWCRRTWSPERSGLAPGSTRTHASKRRPDEPGELGRRQPVAAAMSSRSRPRRFTPTRLPARTTSVSWSCTCTLRTPARAPPGATTIASPARISPRPQRAGHDRADALEREDAVHGQAGRAGVAARLGVLGGPLQRGQQLVQAAPVPRAHRDHLAGGERRALEELAHVRLRQLEQLVVHEVGLGQRDDAAAHAEQLDDREVLDGLRHHAVVGGDDEQEEVDAGGSGHHGAHEPLVAGHVDDAQARAGRQLQLGVAELDGDAALAAPRAGGRCSCR